MGKATKWLKSVLGLKKSDLSSSPSPSSNQRDAAATPIRVKEKQRKWGFVKSYREKGGDFSSSSSSRCGHGPKRCPVAEATATTAAAASGKTAVEVVRLTNSGRSVAFFPSSRFISVEFAAMSIQAAFRGYLARRALRALKALVRLQALVRGNIERKRTAEWLRRMQAMLRAQKRARAVRYAVNELPNVRSRRVPARDEFKYDKIVEVDPGMFSRRGQLHSLPSEYYPRSYSMSQGLQSLYSFEDCAGAEEVFCTAENSPQVMSEASLGGWSKQSPFTPTKSEGSDHPNYMSNTQSWKAKVRSMSAPKQRPQYERWGSSKRSNSAQRGSSFCGKAYPGSGRLDHLGIPIGQNY